MELVTVDYLRRGKMELELERIHSQYYKVNAPRGMSKERNELFRRLINRHSRMMPNFVFTNKHRDGKFTGVINVFTPTNFRAGHLQEVINFLDQSPVSWKWKDGKPNNLPFFDPTVDEDITKEDIEKFVKKYIKAIGEIFTAKTGKILEYRDYQVEAVYKCLKNKTGIVLSGTGSGKSFMISCVLSYLFSKKKIKRATIIVPRQSLIHQFRRNLQEFGFAPNSIGVFYSDEKELYLPITIATYTSLKNLSEEVEEEDDYFCKQDLVICDEVHCCATKKNIKMVCSFTNGQYYMGYTATLPNTELETEQIKSLFGEVVIKKEMKELYEVYNAVCKLNVGILKYDFGKVSLKSRIDKISSTSNYHAEMEWLAENDVMNKHLCKLIVNNVENGRNVVILTKRIEYANRIHDILDEMTAIPSYVIVRSGEKAKTLKQSEEILEKCRDKEERFIIISNAKLFSMGIDLSGIHMIVMLESGKSRVSILQSLGRSVRKGELKDIAYILDVSANMKYSINHLNERYKIYEKSEFEIMEKTIKLDVDEFDNKMKKLKEKY